MSSSKKLTVYIILGLLFGIVVGMIGFSYLPKNGDIKAAKTATEALDKAKENALKKLAESQFAANTPKAEETLKEYEKAKAEVLAKTEALSQAKEKAKKQEAEIKASLLGASAEDVANNLALLSKAFLNMIKMILAPLVFTTLVAGIANIGSGKAIGRLGFRAMTWFITASIASLGLGLVLINLFKDWIDAKQFKQFITTSSTGLKTDAFTLANFVDQLLPKSIIDSMAKNEILAIVVFSVFFGVAVGAMGRKAKAVLIVADEVSHVMLKITGYVMAFAPFAVFGAVAQTIMKSGLATLSIYAKFMGSFYVALIILCGVLILAGFLFIGPRVFNLMARIKDPFVIAFSTASSEAAYPKVMEQLQRFGVPRRICGFVLSLGYSFNLDGSMMYCTFAAIFIAGAYGIDLPMQSQIMLLFLLMVTSKGIAGVPRASLVVIAAALPTINVPAEGVALLFAIDAFLDMGRSATNVVGNSIATAVVAKMEGALRQPGEDFAEESDELVAANNQA